MADFTVRFGPYAGRVVHSRGSQYYWESEKPRAEQIREETQQFVSIRTARQLIQKPASFTSERGITADTMRGSPEMTYAFLREFDSGLTQPRLAVRIYDGNRWYQTASYDNAQDAYFAYEQMRRDYNIGEVIEVEVVNFGLQEL